MKHLSFIKIGFSAVFLHPREIAPFPFDSCEYEQDTMPREWCVTRIRALTVRFR